MSESAWIWMNGELVPWNEATVHVGAHALHYGTGVFEGIRAYDGEQGTGIFRLADHLTRFQRSAWLYRMELPYGDEELTRACWELLDACEMTSAYLRPIAFRGYRKLGLYPLDCPVEVAIMAMPWGAYLGDEALEHGVRAKISSFRRFGSNVLPPQAKATGQYLNSVLAKLEVDADGYEEAILLNEHGRVCEGSGENLFIVKDGKVTTPATSESILPGITRDSIMQVARGLGYSMHEGYITRDDLYLADEVFMTGTAAEVTPVRSVDTHVIGDPGPVTKAIQQAFFATIRGQMTPWSHFLEYRPAAAGEGAVDQRRAG